MTETKSKRSWRKPESFEAERLMRDLVKPFLESRGYAQVEDTRRATGGGESQIVNAHDPKGNPIRFRVRSCWRWSIGRARGKVSAAQLTAKYVDTFEATLDNVIRRNEKAQVTNLLLVQSDGAEIVYAASIPVPELRRLWEKQREVSITVIGAGQMGRIHKNHAENGNSPTLWLMDNRAPGGKAVADVLWNWPGVIDVAKLPVKVSKVDDTYDDLPEVDNTIYGSENAPKRKTTRSEVKRNPDVRREVAARAVDGCEKPGCPDTRTYPGFLDVHHILGVEKSDRVWTCVALCPNCHRESHYGPDAEQLNQALLDYASQFAPTHKGDGFSRRITKPDLRAPFNKAK
jgi:5-methylcytosine-specific restriction protein A